MGISQLLGIEWGDKSTYIGINHDHAYNNEIDTIIGADPTIFIHHIFVSRI